MTELLIELRYLAHVAMVPERRSKELKYNKSMKDLIQEILKRWADDEVNLQSQAAQDALAKEIMHATLKFINNHDGMKLTYK